MDAVAQIPYESEVSERTEYLPLSIAVLGARGNDIGLVDLVNQALVKAEWTTEVDTGRLAFAESKRVRSTDVNSIAEEDQARGAELRR